MPDPLPTTAHLHGVPTDNASESLSTAASTKRSKPAQPKHATNARTLFERLSDFLMREPEDRQQLMEVLHNAHERDLLDDDALSMIEGVLQVSDLAARDIMIPRAQMDMIDIEAEPKTWLPMVLETAHSRFPVYEGKRDKVIGVLLAKDLLRYLIDQETDIRGMLRPAVFIPEAKRLNVLLRDFRANRNHMALVVDEYGGVAGLVTIEDVLEQIVGDIEDEYDFDEEADNILLASDGRYRVKALTEITQFNDTFGTTFSDEDVDTIGGLVTDHLGRVPRRGELIQLANVQFEVLRADGRQVHVLLVERVEVPEMDEDEAI